MKMHIERIRETPQDAPVMRIRSADNAAKQFLHDIRESIIYDEPVCVLEAFALGELAKWGKQRVQMHEDLLRDEIPNEVPTMHDIVIRPTQGVPMKFEVTSDGVKGATSFKLYAHAIDPIAKRYIEDMQPKQPMLFECATLEIAQKQAEVALLEDIAHWHAASVKAWSEGIENGVVDAVEPRIGHLIIDHK